MNKVLRLVLLCLTLMIALPALAQEIQVKGRVIDEKGEAVIGAAVKVKESTKGALTDLDGNFTVSAPRKGHLIISFMGFKSQTIDLSTSKLPLKITLQEESQSLKEVVVVGYGSMQKKDLTGSISSISEKNFQKGAISTPVSSS